MGTFFDKNEKVLSIQNSFLEFLENQEFLIYFKKIEIKKSHI